MPNVDHSRHRHKIPRHRLMPPKPALLTLGPHRPEEIRPPRTARGPYAAGTGREVVRSTLRKAALTQLAPLNR